MKINHAFFDVNQKNDMWIFYNISAYIVRCYNKYLIPLQEGNEYYIYELLLHNPFGHSFSEKKENTHTSTSFPILQNYSCVCIKWEKWTFFSWWQKAYKCENFHYLGFYDTLGNKLLLAIDKKTD